MDVADEAVEIANEIEDIVRGRQTAAVYLAIGMVLGAAEARAERPNLPNLMKIVGNVAREQLDRQRPASQ